MARTVTAHLFTSLNGVVESPEHWSFGVFGPEEGAAMAAAIDGVTDVVMGRVLFEEWSQFWPTKDGDPFGDFINPCRKHVATASGEGDLGWNATAIDGDVVAHVRRLREQDGGGIAVPGGIETIRSLFLAGVVDHLTLTVHPVVTGAGRRLFDDQVPTTRLELVDSTTTSLGNAMLTYALRS